MGNGILVLEETLREAASRTPSGARSPQRSRDLTSSTGSPSRATDSHGSPPWSPKSSRNEILVKFDAAPDRVNRPNPLRERVAAISALRNTTLHSCFVEGMSSNCDPESVSPWVQTVKAIWPWAVRIHTVHEPVMTQDVRLASQRRLREIGHRRRDASGIEPEILPWLTKSVTPPESAV